MSQQRRPGPLRGGGIVDNGTGLATAAMGLIVISTLAGCGSSAGPASGSSTPAAQAATNSAVASLTAPPSGPAAAFASIVEPFDPGHPARHKPAPASCGGQPTTLAIEQCYEARIENADAAIDAVQRAAYRSGSQAQRAAIVAADSAWLSARQPVCAKAFHGGGTIDEVDIGGLSARREHGPAGRGQEHHAPGGDAQVHGQHRPQRAVLVHHAGGAHASP